MDTASPAGVFGVFAVEIAIPDDFAFDFIDIIDNADGDTDIVLNGNWVGGDQPQAAGRQIGGQTHTVKSIMVDCDQEVFFNPFFFSHIHSFFHSVWDDEKILSLFMQVWFQQTAI